MKFHLRNYFAFFFLIVTNWVFSQKTQIQVIDSYTKVGIDNVHIQINEDVYVTDKLGNLSLNFSPKKGSLWIVTHLGYLSKKIIYKGEVSLLITLSEKNNLLDEVSINSKLLKDRIKFKKINNMESRLSGFKSIFYKGKIFIISGDKSIYSDPMLQAAAENPRSTNTLSSWVNESFKHQSFYLYSNRVYIYDVYSNTFQENSIELNQRAYHSVQNYKNKAYIIGGKKISYSGKKEYLVNQIEVLNLDTFKVEIDKTNPHLGVDVQTQTFAENLIVMGGSIKENKSGKRLYNEDIHLYNLKSGLWYKLMKNPFKTELKTIRYKDKIIVFHPRSNKLTNISQIDLKSGVSSTLGILNTEYIDPSFIAYNDEIIMVQKDKMIFLNLESNKVFEYKTNLEFYGSNIHIYDNSLILIGGYRKDFYKREPSSAIYSVNLSEIEQTRVIKSYSIL